MKGTRRGIVMVLTLLLMALLLVMGMGFLQQRVGQSRAANAGRDELQARTLARSGLDDAMLKLAKKPDFPPLWDTSQKEFQYTEIVQGSDGMPIGGFRVSVSPHYAGGTYWLVRIQSQGFVGDQAQPQAKSSMMAEVDVSEIKRPIANSNAPQLTNPNLFQYIFVHQGEAR